MSSRRERTRGAILRATERLFLEGGVRGVAMEQVAGAAGVSRQAVYLHFQSRTGLLLALLDDIAQTRGLPELVQRTLEAPSALEALDRAIELHITYDPRIRDVVRLLDATRRDDPVAEAAWSERMVLRRAGLRQVATRLGAEGVLDAAWSVQDAADILWAVLSPQVYQALVVEAGWRLPDYQRHIRTLLHRTLLDSVQSSGGHLADAPARLSSQGG